MSQILVLLLVLVMGACSAQKIKPLSDAELADLGKTFNIDDEEFKKFRPAPIKETFTVEQTEVMPNEVAPLAIPVIAIKNNPKVATKNDQVKSSGRKMPTQTITEKLPVPKETPTSILSPSEAIGSGGQFDGLDQQSEIIWSKFSKNFSSTEVQVIKIKYLGITVGHITLRSLPDMQIGNVEAHHFRGELKSESYYEMLYKLDDVLESYVSKKKFLPIKFFLAQRESGKNIDDLQLFDHEKLRTYHWYKKEKKGVITKTEKQGDLPKYFQDSFSALYFMRGLPIKKGLHYEFPIINRGKLSISKIDVLGFEKINVMGKTFDAILMRATNQIPGVEDKKDDMHIWFSADETRMLLKFNTKIKLGAVEGEMIRYER